MFYQAPLYPYALGILYALARPDAWLVRGVQALLGALSCVLLARAGAGFVGRGAGLCAGLLLAAYPPAIFADGLVQKSSLDLFLGTSILASCAGFLARRRWPWLVVLGAAVGALTLNRENAGVLALVIAPWLLLAFPDAAPRRRAAWAGAFLAAFLATLAPVAWRNHRVGGELVLTTSQFGANFYIGNHAGSRGLYDPLVPGRGDARVERADATRLAEQATGRTLTPGEVSDHWFRRALGDVRDDPARWARLLAWKLFLAFHAVELVDSESIGAFASEAPLLRVLAACLDFGVLLPLAALGVWATRREWRRLLVLHGMLAALALSVVLFFVFARYRLPMVPILMLFAGAGLRTAPEQRDARRGEWLRRWAPGLLCAAALAVPANWPLPGYRDDEVTWFNLGVTLLDAGRLDEAVQSLGRAVEIAPSFAAGHYQLGRALRAAQRHPEAASELALAVRHSPDLAEARYLLAVDLVRRSNRLDEGIAHLERVVVERPEFAPARIDLALALMARGDRAAAARASRAALRLAPDSLAVANNLAWILATHPDPRERSGAEAVELAERLRRATGGERPEVLDTLAAAYAEARRYDDATATARDALAMLRDARRDDLARELERRLRLYEQGRAYREPADALPGGR